MSEEQDPKDLSTKAISLARHIDRLPPGEFSMTFKKRRESWYLLVHGEEYGLAQLVIGKDNGEKEEG